MASSIRTKTLQLHRQTVGTVERNGDGRILRLFNGSYEEVPLNIGTGTHYTWIYAGTPPQRASVIVDTGSHVTAFPCSGCEGCGKHTDLPFNTKFSKTLKYPQCSADLPIKCSSCDDNHNCILYQAYTEGSSWKATVVEDLVFLGDAALNPKEKLESHFGTRLMFGCQTHETGLFISQISDGIMGMSNTETNIVRKLHNENKIDSSVFSLCFTKNGGSMALGSPHLTRHKGILGHVKISTMKNGWYGVTMKDIRINNKSIGIKDFSSLNEDRKVIIDSGTTNSYLPYTIQKKFERSFKKYFREGYKTSEQNGYTEEDIQSLPSIQYVMEGDDGIDFIFDVPPDQYLEKTANGHYYAGIYLSETSGGVIGANLMMGHDFVFDPDNSRVGIAKADCEYSLNTENMKPQLNDTQPIVSVAPTIIDVLDNEKSAEPSTSPPVTQIPETNGNISDSKVPTSTSPLQNKIFPTTEIMAIVPQMTTISNTIQNESLNWDSSSMNGLSNAQGDNIQVNDVKTNWEVQNKQVEQPMVLMISGIVIAVVFLAGIISLFTTNRRNRAPTVKFSKLKNVPDDEEINDEYVASTATVENMNDESEDDTFFEIDVDDSKESEDGHDRTTLQRM